MFDSEALSHDPLTGTTEIFHFEEGVSKSDGDTIVHQVVQDVTDIVEDNKARFADTDERARYGEMSRVASIPMAIYMDLRRRGVLDDQEALRAWLNNPDNRVFRTRPGRL